MTTPVTSETVRLRDGRDLTVRVVGDPAGEPVLYFHGSGTCGLEAVLLAEEAAAAGLRLLAPDRPGTGGSTAHAGRLLVDHVDDAQQALDALGVSEAVVAGTSGGSLYAKGTAALHPQRTLRLVDVVPVAPTYDPGARKATPRPVRFASWLGRTAPPLLEAALRRQLSRASTVEALQKPHRRRAADAGLFSDEVVATRFAAAAAGGSAYGSGSAARDFVLVGTPWGFDPFVLTVPVHVVVGERDDLRPVGEELARRIPGAQLTVLPGGHLAAFTDAGRATLVRLLAGGQ